MDINLLSKEIIGAAMQVHRALGPGLLINFNVNILQQGIRRVVLGLPE
jgi:hypothetical protein